MSRTRLLILVALALVCALAPAAMAATYFVSNGSIPNTPVGSDANPGTSWAAPLQTAGMGIAKAVAGDTVKVLQGTYVENLAMKDKVALLGGFNAVKSGKKWVESRDWNLYPTILDGNQAGSVIQVSNCPDNTTLIEGFTISHGTGTAIDLHGQYPVYVGGGIYCSSSNPTIRFNRITGNVVQYSSAGWGGGGIFCLSSSPLILNNIIDKNTGGGGGAIYCDSSSNAKIFGNTIAYNRAMGACGGVYVDNASVPILANNIVAFNYGDPGYWGSNIFGIGSFGGGVPSAHSLLYYNDFYNPGGWNYEGGNYITGDINLDPLFVDGTMGDYHLQAASPCKNAGDNSRVLTAVDLDNQTRIMGGTVDIGAYEIYVNDPPTLVSTSPADGATKVLTRTSPTVTFSEGIAAGSNYSGITMVNDATGLPVGVTRSIGGSVLTLTPSTALAKSTHFTVTIPANGVQDLTGLTLVGPCVFGFTTGTR